MLLSINNQTSINDSNLAFKGVKNKFAEKIIQSTPSPVNLMDMATPSPKTKVRSLKSLIASALAWKSLLPLKLH